jgi:signal peptidase I
MGPPRRPWVAVVLSFLGTGLGQLYNGRVRKFLALQIAMPLFVLLLLWGVVALPIAPFNVLLLTALPAAAIAVALDAFKDARALRDAPRQWYSRWPSCLVVFLAGAVFSDPFQEFIKGSWVHAVAIPGGSMSPTLVVGDRLFLDKACYGLRVPYVDTVFRRRAPSRGDVVMLISPYDGKRLLKRVVGLPGEPYAFTSSAGAGMTDWSPVVVPPDQFLVLGDNRNNSFDSRYFGFVKTSAVLGKVAIVYFSWDSAASRPRWERIGARVR